MSKQPYNLFVSGLSYLAIVFFVIGSFFLTQVAQAQSPTINYQGKLTDDTGATVPDGDYNMRFWLSTSPSAATTSPSTQWTESLTGGNQVTVTNGLFSVMLGSVDTLTGVDFAQDLYLGVEIGGTGAVAWDGEMSPRKPLGTVPAAFQAFDANNLGGVASSSFLRSDQADSMTAFLALTGGASASDLIVTGTATTTNLVVGSDFISDLTGAGLTISGNALSVSTSTLNLDLSDTTGILAATRGGTGLSSVTENQLLIGGAGDTWTQVATSSLGLGNGTFLGLTDTPGSFTANRLLFSNGAGDAVTDSANLTFDGTDINLGGLSSLNINGQTLLTASTTLGSYGFASGPFAGTGTGNLNFGGGLVNTSGNRNIALGPASLVFNNSGDFNIAIGMESLESTPGASGSSNTAVGYKALEQLGGNSSNNLAFGNYAGQKLATTSNSVLLGFNAAGGTGVYEASRLVVVGRNAGASLSTGADNNLLLGYQAADSLTTGANNIIIGYDVEAPSNTADGQLNIGNLLFGTGIDGTGTTLSSGNIGIGTTTPLARLSIESDSIVDGIMVSNTNPASTGSGLIVVDENGDFAADFGYNNLLDEAYIWTYQADPIKFATNNTERMRLDASGNLGIGTSTPASKLDVWGDFRVGTGSVPTLFTDVSSGRVGIGSSSPAAVLSVSGEDGTSATPTGAAMNVLEVIGNSSLGFGQGLLMRSGSDAQTISPAEFIMTGSSGSTGGSLTLQGADMVSGSSGGTINLFGGDTQLGASSAGDINILAGGVALAGKVTISGGDGYFADGGVVIDSGNYDTSFAGGLTSQNTYIFGGGTIDTFSSGNLGNGGNVVINGGRGINGGVDGSVLLATSSTMRVGIGTSSPSSKLTVAGDTYIGGALRATGTVRFDALTSGLLQADANGNLTAVATSSLGLAAGSVTSVAASVPTGWTVTGSPITDAGTLAFAYDTGYAAVLTASSTNWNDFFNTPSSRITAGTGLAWSGNTLNTSGLGDGTFLGLSDTPSSFTANRLLFTNGAGDAVTDSADLVFDGVNFGIGTSSPNAKLTVAGDINIDDTDSDGIISVLGTPFFRASSTLNNISLGQGAGESYLAGIGFSANQFNVNLGYQAGQFASSTSSFQNKDTVLIGYQAGQYNRGSDNIYIGDQAGQFSTSSASSNVFIGARAGQYAADTAGQNIMIGDGAGGNNLGFGSVILGTRAGQDSTGDRNLYFGDQAGRFSAGSDNVFLGNSAGWFSDGSQGVAIGKDALENNNGSGTIAIGYGAANNATDAARSIFIGYDIDAPSTTDDNQLNIGNLLFGTGVDGTGTTLSSGNIGIGTTSPSSKLDVWGDFRVGTGSVPTLFVDTSTRTAGIGGQSNATSTLTITRDTDASIGTNNATLLLQTTQNDFTGNSFGIKNNIAINQDNSGYQTYGIQNNFTGGNTDEYYLYGTENNVDSNSLSDNFYFEGLGNNVTVQAGSVNAVSNVLTSSNDAYTAYMTGVANSFETHDTDEAYGLYAGSKFGGASTGGFQYGVYIDLDDADIAGHSIFVTDDSLPSYFGSNVGIGTTSPSSKLDVWGDFRVGTGSVPTLFADTSANWVGIGTTTRNFDTGATTTERLTVAGGGIIANSPTNPQIVGGVDTAGLAFDVTIAGRYAYVADNASGLQIIDISDPTNPTIVGSEATTGGARAVTLAGRYAYVADLASGLQIIDISDPTNPTIIGSEDTPGNAYGVTIAGRYAYVADGSSGLQIIDISDPQNPTTVGSEDTPDFAYDVTIAGRYAYVADGDSGLLIIDISDPTNPTIVGSEDTPNFVRDVTIAGRYAYVVDFLFASDLLIIDISDPTNPTTVGSEATTGGAFGVTIAGRYAYVADGASGLQIIDISDPTNPTTVGSEDTSGSARAVTLAGRYAYVADFGGGLQIIDIGGSEFSSLFAGAIGATQANIDQDLIVGQNALVNSNLTVGNDARVGGLLSIQGYSSSTDTLNQALLSLGGDTDRNSFMSFLGRESATALNVWSAGLNQADGSFRIASSTGLATNPFFTIGAGGNVGIGTTTPNSKLTIENTTLDGAGVSGLDQFLTTTNSVDAAVQFGNRFNLTASNTATTTIVGSLYRVADDTTFGNTVRGLEVQTNRGGNSQGENTALSGFARTFGVRGITSGDAGTTFEPAGGFFENTNTTQGNALRAYSGSITSATLMSLFQDTSDFTGTGLQMNFGNTTGSFSSSSSKYLDFQNAGTSVFTVSAFGTTTIGDGTTNNMAGLQIGFGGICVDNDGTCVASTTGRITAVETLTGNSDLAEIYFSDQDLQPGEIVTLAGELSVARADQTQTMPILGVVSTKPGLTLGFDDVSTRAGEAGFPIALSGRVPIRLSTEAGPIKQGDRLMLSSLPGVAMKATGTGATIGIALEDFDDTRMYSDTYLNQFGDDMVDPVYELVTTNADSRINDGCYFGGGSAAGDEPCVPLVATTSVGQIAEVNDRLEQESVAEQLQALERVNADTRMLADGTPVRVGQVVMFVDMGQKWLTPEMELAITDMMRTDTRELANLMNNTTDGDETTMGVMATVIEAVVQLWERVTGHEERLDTLEAENAALQQRLQQIEQQVGSIPAEDPAPAGDPVSNPPVTETAEPVTEPEASTSTTTTSVETPTELDIASTTPDQAVASPEPVPPQEELEATTTPAVTPAIEPAETEELEEEAPQADPEPADEISTATAPESTIQTETEG